MACQLGFDNANKDGGTYRGKDIGKALGKMYLQLALDGYIDSESEVGPLISVDFSDKPGSPVGKDHALFLYQLFGDEKDNELGLIHCTGSYAVNEDDPSCKGCPYLQD